MQISMNDVITEQEVIALYKANHWSSAEKPKELMAALRNSHSLVTARADGKLVGIGNAISDGHLVVYFPHMLVDPMAQGQGVGRRMMAAMLEKYAGFHQQNADGGRQGHRVLRICGICSCRKNRAHVDLCGR